MPGEYIFEFAQWPRVIFSSFAGESTWHVALKLLAYLLYRERRPLVERGVGQRYKPDLVVLRHDGRVQLWIDCGETSLRKLDRVLAANPVARVVIVKDTPRHLESYARLADAALPGHPRLLYLAFGGSLVDDLSRALRQRNRVSFTVGPSGLQVGLNGSVFDGLLVRRAAQGR